MALLESGGEAALATRPPWVEKAGDAADFVVSPLVYVGPGVSFASGAAGVHWNVTLATHLSAERLPHLLRLCETWKGPVTAVVFVPGSGRAVRRLLHTVGKWGSAAASLALHLVQPVGLELAQEAVYPINLMRAIAQRLAQTPWVLVIDADLHLTHEAAHFSAALAEAEADLQAGEAHVPGFRGLDMDDFLAGARNPHAHVAPCKGLHAFVVIALEASMDVTRVPAPPSHAEIWQAVASGAIGPMHPYFPRAYMPANYRRWLSERGRVAFTVPFAPSFEPYLIVPRAAPAPDPAFVDRGMNKAQWTAHLFAAGYSFTVLPHVSVVDVPTSVGRQRPHMPSVLPAWDSAASHVLGTYGVKTYRPFGWQALDEEILQSARRLPAWSSFLSAVTVLVEGRRVQRGVQSAVPRAGDALRAPGGVVLVLQLCVFSREMRSLLQHYCSMPSISQVVAVAACPQQMIEPAVEACPLGQPLHIVDQAQAGVPRFSFRGLPPLQSDAVLLLRRPDKLPASAVKLLASTWLASPMQHAGTSALHLHLPTRTNPHASAQCEGTASAIASYNMVDASGSMVHAAWLGRLAAYTEEMRGMGLKPSKCMGLAVSFAAAAQGGLPPLLLRPQAQWRLSHSPLCSLHGNSTLSTAVPGYPASAADLRQCVQALVRWHRGVPLFSTRRQLTVHGRPHATPSPHPDTGPDPGS